MWQHFDRIIDEGLRNGPDRGLRRIDVERRIAATTHVVWLRRRNRVRQAISWTKALQSDGWHMESQRAYRGAYVYDFPGLCLARVEDPPRRGRLVGLLPPLGARPLVLYHQDCLADLPGAWRRSHHRSTCRRPPGRSAVLIARGPGRLGQRRVGAPLPRRLRRPGGVGRRRRPSPR